MGGRRGAAIRRTGQRTRRRAEMKRLLASLLVIAACISLYMWRGVLPGLAGSEEAVPVATVRKGDLTVWMTTRGDVKAQRSITLYAPISVTEVRLVQIAKSGTILKAGD